MSLPRSLPLATRRVGGSACGAGSAPWLQCTSFHPLAFYCSFVLAPSGPVGGACLRADVQAGGRCRDAAAAVFASATAMVLSMSTMFQSVLLFVNAFAVLHEQRFLNKGMSVGGRGG